MKGIILAGGSGTRLYPLTRAASKQLMPIYDKPMIYYPLSTLMLAGIKDILIITDDENRIIEFEEKPEHPKSNFAVTGLYFYDNDVVEIAKNIKPSPRGELEITDVNKAYLDRGDLSVELMGRGFAWLDTGTHESLLQAAQYIETVQRLQNVQVANLEEIAYRMGYITKEKVLELAQPFKKNEYGQYLLRLIGEA